MPGKARRLSPDGHIIYRAINATLTTQTYQQLLETKEKLGANSYAEVITYALEKAQPHLQQTTNK